MGAAIDECIILANVHPTAAYTLHRGLQTLLSVSLLLRKCLSCAIAYSTRCKDRAVFGLAACDPRSVVSLR